MTANVSEPVASHVGNKGFGYISSHMVTTFQNRYANGKRDNISF